jgi:D-alanine-D-alanine ligase
MQKGKFFFKHKIKDNRKVVAVIFGGKSVEHDISIITGVQVLRAIDRQKFDALPIYISKENEWFYGEQLADIATFVEEDFLKKCKKISLCAGGKIFFEKKHCQKFFKKIDFAFLALHGSNGENGGIQGLLESLEVKYSSPDVFGSGICMNKLATKYVCQALDIKVVNYKAVFENEWSKNFDVSKTFSNLKFPLIVKPNNLGSSVGISFCKTEQQTKNALSFAFLFDKQVLVEEAVQNLREFNLAIVGNRFGCETSSIEEVKIEKDFLTFENKYCDEHRSQMGRIFPAEIDDETKEKITTWGKRIFLALGLKGLVRIDFLFDDATKELFLNEVNTIPGSLANYLFRDKYSFSKLLEKIVELCEFENEVDQKKIYKFSSSVLKDFKNSSKNFLKK